MSAAPCRGRAGGAVGAYRGELVLSALIEDRAERLGDRTAVTSAAGDLAYGELAERAARVAGALVALGVEPGDRVATMLDNSLEYLAAWLGVCWAGAVDVPVNTALKGAFLEHVLLQCGAAVLVVDGRRLDRLEPLRLPDLRHVVVVGGPPELPLPGLSAHRFEDCLAHAPAARTRRAESDLVYIMYTSGTTGPSKGAMHCNRSVLLSNVVPWLEILGLTGEDVAYSMFPLFHGTARNAVVTSTIWAGGRVVLRDGFSASRFCDDVRATGATFFAYMGVVLHLLFAQEPRPDDADNAVRVAFGGAAPHELVEAFERRFGLELLEVYGSTELGVATAPRIGTRKLGTMGRPRADLLLEIHDEAGRPLPAGAQGEIVVRPEQAYCIFQGYWQEPEATVEAFRNLWFHTGDGGYLDEDGYLVFTDRIKDSLRRRGENISSFEVERAVRAHPDVLECAAYARPLGADGGRGDDRRRPPPGAHDRPGGAVSLLRRGDAALRGPALRPPRRGAAEDAVAARREVPAARAGRDGGHPRPGAARHRRAEGLTQAGPPARR